MSTQINNKSGKKQRLPTAQQRQSNNSSQSRERAQSFDQMKLFGVPAVKLQGSRNLVVHQPDGNSKNSVSELFGKSKTVGYREDPYVNNLSFEKAPSVDTSEKSKQTERKVPSD